MNWFIPIYLLLIQGYENVRVLGYNIEYLCPSYALIVEADMPLRIRGVYCSENQPNPFDWNVY
jgi:hypothetical protein